MSIINSYHINSKPIISPQDVYVKSEITFDACIINFSSKIMDALIEDDVIELISDSTLKSVSCYYPIYRFKGTNIGIFKTTVGAPITSGLMEEVNYIHSCNKFVMFGTCGGLDKNIPASSLIVPTHAYRDEGVSYHYMEPSDYIEINNSSIVAKILKDMNIEFVEGKTWTTDAFFRETEEEMALRRQEGCIAVEMEISACQAVANYREIEFYTFLYRADNLDSEKWDRGVTSNMPKDERLKILNVAFTIAKIISKG